jgi:hypothetical protein
VGVRVTGWGWRGVFGGLGWTGVGDGRGEGGEWLRNASADGMDRVAGVRRQRYYYTCTCSVHIDILCF